MGERKGELQNPKPPPYGTEYGTSAVYEDVTSEAEPTIIMSGMYEQSPAIVQPPGQYGEFLPSLPLLLYIYMYDTY